MLENVNRMLAPTIGRVFMRFIAPIFALRIYLFPLGLVVAAFLLATGQYSTVDLQLFVAFFLLTTLGLSLGFHRLATHRSYKPHPLLRFLFLAMGTISFQAPVTYWVAMHIKHHACADRDGDPHSPVVEGFWHGHYGWTFSYKRDLAFEEYKRVIVNDPMLMFFQHSYLLWLGLAIAVCFGIAGWSGVLWGFVLPTVISDHLTRFINSWGHLRGAAPFETGDNSRNNWWLALITHGDGWHNNHHAFPRAAFHGLRWYEVDLSGYIIRLLEWLGLATHVVRVPPEKIAGKLKGEIGTAVLADLD
jgi:stearoyl-CoA desaturase (delta-9 desaturase)